VLNPLFNADNPDSQVYLSAVNPNLEEIYPNAMIETGFEEIGRRAPWPNSEGRKRAERSRRRDETVRF
jgi:glutaminyl-tRNA synthetase